MSGSKKPLDFISFLIIVLFLLVSLSACTNLTISQDKAIQIAIGDCKIPHLVLVGDPQNIRAKLLTLDEAYQLIKIEGATTNFDVPMDTKVWFVQMDGQLQLVGGPPPVQTANGTAITPTPPSPFWGTCSVILDAKTGSVILVTG